MGQQLKWLFDGFFWQDESMSVPQVLSQEVRGITDLNSDSYDRIIGGMICKGVCLKRMVETWKTIGKP